VKLHLDWARDGAGWRHREASRFVRVGHLNWHVQDLGAGAPLVLLHGTAASTHTWRDVMPVLMQRYRVIAIDLPGHGFTSGWRLSDATLPGMARAVAELLRVIGVAPLALIGHSAGAAVAVRLAHDGGASPRAVMGINAALLPFPGAAGPIATAMARALFVNPVAPAFFAAQATDRAVARVIRSTGSHLDQTGIGFYRLLFSSYAHVQAALAMMARWDLATLARDLPKLQTPLLLLSGANDRAIPPSQAEQVSRLAPQARRVVVEGVGHLAHEERPTDVAKIILDAVPD
jgi:magnesium chelatase accessory protein